MEILFFANPYTMAGIGLVCLVCLVFIVLNYKTPYDRKTQSHIAALRRHVEDREKYAMEGIARRKAEKRAR
nr:hypothetical protein [uncultured Albidiferax sp.]